MLLFWEFWRKFRVVSFRLFDKMEEERKERKGKINLVMFGDFELGVG